MLQSPPQKTNQTRMQQATTKTTSGTRRRLTNEQAINPEVVFRAPEQDRSSYSFNPMEVVFRAPKERPTGVLT